MPLDPRQGGCLRPLTTDELEKEFGHEKTRRTRAADKPRGPDNWEYFRGKESRINPKEVQVELTALWHQSDSGPAVAAALKERGYIHCEGNRGLFVVDQAGHEHSLARRVGARVQEVDARMADIDRDALPSVEEARALAREHAEDRQQRDRAQPQSGHDKRDAALQVVAEVLAEAVHDASKTKERPDEPRPPKTEAGPAHAEENSSPGHAPPQDEPSAAPAPHDRSLKPEPLSAGNTVASGPQQAPPARSSTTPELGPTPQPSLFERLAERLSQAINALDSGQTVAEAAEVTVRRPSPTRDGIPLMPWEIPPPALRAPASTSTPFERIAQELVRDAKQVAPALETFAVVAAAVAEGKPPSEFERLAQELTHEATPVVRESAAAAPQPSEFQRVTEEQFAAVQDGGGDDAFVPEGLRWLAQKTASLGDEQPPNRAPTPFDRVTGELFQAVRDNGGEPEPGFWRRGVALLDQARDRAAQWIRETSRTFAGRILRSRNTTHDKDQPGLER